MIDHGLTPLDPDREVVVTKEEHHQAALAPHAPRGTERARRVAVELHAVTGRQAGRRTIEARLGGRRVGELTHLMSQRYAPLVDDVVARGGRPGCVGLVRHGRRGLEVEVRLPEAPPGAPIPPPPVPSGPGRGRTPYLIGAGVIAMLLVIGANVGGGDPAVSTPTDTAAGAVAAPASTAVVHATTTAPSRRLRPRRNRRRRSRLSPARRFRTLGR